MYHLFRSWVDVLLEQAHPHMVIMPQMMIDNLDPENEDEE
jgi:hypothetical protein